ncbi:hypothetical protein ACHAXS_007069 [Conticribra weissflogii]
MAPTRVFVGALASIWIAACSIGDIPLTHELRESLLVTAFAPVAPRQPWTRRLPTPSMKSTRAKQHVVLFSTGDDDDGKNNAAIEDTLVSGNKTDANKNDDSITASILQRFNSPRIDDPGLPLTDVLIAQIVAPSVQIFWIFINRAPMPTWLAPISSYFGEAPELAPRGSLLAPTLIHGAGLAVCWLAGALAGRMYEREAFFLDDESKSGLARYQTLISRLVQAGAFATGVLIVSTQMDLLLEFKRYVQYGESEKSDLRLLVATVEVINDVFFEALVITTWRIIHANFMSTPENRSRRF